MATVTLVFSDIESDGEVAVSLDVQCDPAVPEDIQEDGTPAQQFANEVVGFTHRLFDNYEFLKAFYLAEGQEPPLEI